MWCTPNVISDKLQDILAPRLLSGAYNQIVKPSLLKKHLKTAHLWLLNLKQVACLLLSAVISVAIAACANC